jgi:hypothetical protein
MPRKKTMSRQQGRTETRRQARPASVLLPVALGRMIFCNACIMAVSIFQGEHVALERPDHSFQATLPPLNFNVVHHIQ